MLNFECVNVNEALPKGIITLKHRGILKTSRGLRTLDAGEPASTTYLLPQQCVLWDPVRDCNPFLHIMDAFWIIAGRQDVDSLAFFSKNIRQFSDDGKIFHGAYGHRLRNHFNGHDQLEALISKMAKSPDTRQAVLQLWDCTADLTSEPHKDFPCNNTIYFKIDGDRLRMTVCCRSNDIIWGAYGANAVQFSFLMQYVHARLLPVLPNLKIGEYTQISDSYHMYLDDMSAGVLKCLGGAPGHKSWYMSGYPHGGQFLPLKTLGFSPMDFYQDTEFLTELNDLFNASPEDLENSPEFKTSIVQKLRVYTQLYQLHKDLKTQKKICRENSVDFISDFGTQAKHLLDQLDMSLDWDLACALWLERRTGEHLTKEGLDKCLQKM